MAETTQPPYEKLQNFMVLFLSKKSQKEIKCETDDQTQSQISSHDKLV